MQQECGALKTLTWALGVRGSNPDPDGKPTEPPTPSWWGPHFGDYMTVGHVLHVSLMFNNR